MNLHWFVVGDRFSRTAILNFFQEKKKKKDVKAKPILVNKIDAQLTVEVSSPYLEINHFDKIHPKDDLEMRRHSVSSF